MRAPMALGYLGRDLRPARLAEDVNRESKHRYCKTRSRAVNRYITGTKSIETTFSRTIRSMAMDPRKVQQHAGSRRSVILSVFTRPSSDLPGLRMHNITAFETYNMCILVVHNALLHFNFVVIGDDHHVWQRIVKHMVPQGLCLRASSFALHIVLVAPIFSS